MELKNEFFIHLPSNVQTDYTKENTPSHYHTTLPRPFEIDPSEWRVALYEITYPHTWNNVSKPGNRLQLTVVDDNGRAHMKTVHIDPAYFSNGYDLGRAVTREIDIKGGKTTFSYNHSTNKMRIKLPDNESVFLSRKMARQMGWFTDTEFPTPRGREDRAIRDNLRREREEPEEEDVEPEGAEREPLRGESTETNMEAGGRRDERAVRERPEILDHATYTSDYGLDLNFNTHSLYVYCSIVEESLVGNKFVKLLRRVPTHPKRHGEYITDSFVNPQYLPLSTSFINYVEILITDDVGKPIAFDRGKVSITLHFKKQLRWTNLNPFSKHDKKWCVHVLSPARRLMMHITYKVEEILERYLWEPLFSLGMASVT